MAAHLDTRSLLYPNPDLVIRTSGETRTSGFMLWQTAYSEWIFLNKHLPDMNRDDLDECVAEYEQRQRRFGK
jgi:undecaprenyl diphosphate synthase